MKYKLLATRSKNQINIGDYIQSLAASQFLPSIDGFVQREKLNQYSSEEVTIIMNGWFMHQPENWPPSPQINPIFLSFHLNILAKDQLLSEKSVAYFKKHKPIGCRDFQSVQFLKSKNVDAYFSGCLTLTLGEKYFSKEKEDIYSIL